MGTSNQKHWLLLPVKLRMTELNAWKYMVLGSTFRCMCNYGFCFEVFEVRFLFWSVYVSMTVFVACFDFRMLPVCITWRKLMILSWRQCRSQGKGRHLSAGVAFWGRNLRLECHVTTTKCQMSADASNYDLQNVECQSLLPSCKISSRSPRFAKRAITKISDVLRRRLCLQQPASDRKSVV